MSLEFFIQNVLPEIPRKKLERTGLLCNQTSYSHNRKKYLFEILEEIGCLNTIFLPEHGLFAELQDQVGLVDTKPYRDFTSAQVISLYQDTKDSLYPAAERLQEIDSLIVDIQDIGSRYYTFAATLGCIFTVLARYEIDIQVYVIERTNPAGNFVEGTLLTEEYSSFVGYAGLPHRHGLTIGELARFYQKNIPGLYKLNVIHDPQKNYMPQKGISMDFLLESAEIYPSPNMPGPLTPIFYSGQCLWEGTNLSEGRGTTRPFEIFGAPFLQKSKNPPSQNGVHLRRLRFIPAFHKFKDTLCEGFQLHWEKEKAYHSLGHSLKLLRWAQEVGPGSFSWNEGVYEFCSQKKAIEILAGDADLLGYLYGKESFASIRAKLNSAEEEWIKISSAYLIHPRRLQKIELHSKEDFA